MYGVPNFVSVRNTENEPKEKQKTCGSDDHAVFPVLPGGVHLLAGRNAAAPDSADSR